MGSCTIPATRRVSEGVRLSTFAERSPPSEVLGFTLMWNANWPEPPRCQCVADPDRLSEHSFAATSREVFPPLDACWLTPRLGRVSIPGILEVIEQAYESVSPLVQSNLDVRLPCVRQSVAR